MKIYISNLGFSIDAEGLKKLFTPHGVVASVAIVLDKFTNRSRGFAFIEMPEINEAKNAITALNGSSLEGRSLIVTEAKERNDQRNKSSFY